MVMWWYLPTQRISAAVARSIPRDKLCLSCLGPLARIAERNIKAPYMWVPCGYICTKCNTMFMGVQ